jgi:Arc/MetJ-type ribon-helix-helix transcriptional regulator
MLRVHVKFVADVLVNLPIGQQPEACRAAIREVDSVTARPAESALYAKGHEFYRAVTASRLHDMVFGMATTKITVTLDDDRVKEIRDLVAAGQSANVSAFVQHAVGVALHDAAGWKEMLEDALRQTGGPLTKRERTWADALLSPHKRKRGAKKGKAA